eukprot:tig00000339_g24171.t1
MEGADSIRIYRNGTPIGFASSALSTSYIDDSTALTWGTEYSYQVAGIVGGVEYDKSDPLLVWTMPNAPTNVTASAPNDQQQPVSLSWTASTGATGYKIYRDGAYLTDSATNSYSDTTTVWVQAQPVVLEWSVPVTGVTVSYNIYRGGVFLASDTSSPFSDTTTVYGTTYTYTIKGVNQIGEEGPQSSSASATTANAPVLGTFSYTGADQTFVVPTGTVAVRVIVWAAGVEAENAQVRGSVEARVLA